MKSLARSLAFGAEVKSKFRCLNFARLNKHRVLGCDGPGLTAQPETPNPSSDSH